MWQYYNSGNDGDGGEHQKTWLTKVTEKLVYVHILNSIDMLFETVVKHKLWWMRVPFALILKNFAYPWFRNQQFPLHL